MYTWSTYRVVAFKIDFDGTPRDKIDKAYHSQEFAYAGYLDAVARLDGKGMVTLSKHGKPMKRTIDGEETHYAIKE